MAEAEASSGPSRQNRVRCERLLRLGVGSRCVRIVEDNGATAGCRPLVILNSLDFPMPPSLGFYETMRAAGFRVIFIERPGCGTSSPLPDVLLKSDIVTEGAASMAEAALLMELFRQLDLEDIVLMALGSANPVCYRLCLTCPRVSLSIFSNSIFNQNILDVFRPKWFQGMLGQTIQSRAGAQILALGIRYRLRQNLRSLYAQVLQKSAGDLACLEQNSTDFDRAGQLFQRISTPTIAYDLNMTLRSDTLLKDNVFEAVNAVALSGLETTDHWKSELEKEANRLSVDVAYVPHGDVYAPYASPQQFLELVEDRAGPSN